jgi:hypothetical protein
MIQIQTFIISVFRASYFPPPKKKLLSYDLLQGMLQPRGAATSWLPTDNNNNNNNNSSSSNDSTRRSSVQNYETPLPPVIPSRSEAQRDRDNARATALTNTPREPHSCYLASTISPPSASASSKSSVSNSVSHSSAPLLRNSTNSTPIASV